MATVGLLCCDLSLSEGGDCKASLLPTYGSIFQLQEGRAPNIGPLLVGMDKTVIFYLLEMKMVEISADIEENIHKKYWSPYTY